MPIYRFCRIDDRNREIESFVVEAIDDDGAIAEAIRLDHAHFIDIWLGTRMISRVCPRNRGSHSN
ncbi:hypothetical protein [Sphingomonas immobilis]|uniref:Uncharacterized protein n=1 Tax=Sphingomonas immobilis TaxID=3063997 RepID=A0ABT8ZW57_9SPHN|nr:hypothetical protein [Sphingomonas sp. CA1-15]MDO7841798.1 hypothetical protein [Sphingomonas sp. CA1-15]